MSFLRQLTAKPWEADQIRVDNVHDGGTFDLPKVSLGLRVFLVVATVLFSLSVVAYGDRMLLPDWHPSPEPALMWLNTVVLLASSAALQWASVGARRGQIDGVRTGLLAGGILAFAFVVGQLVVWQQMADLGYYASTNPANAFYYMLTALHGLHVVGGLVAWARTTAKVWRGAELNQVSLSVELCAIYWHFLLVIWLVLFGLLLFT